MQPTDPSNYTDVSQEDFDRFKQAAKAKGMNISGNSDNVTFDLIPVHIEYKPDAKTFSFTVHEPFWRAPGTTTGALHNIVAASMNVATVPIGNENPRITGVYPSPVNPAVQAKAKDGTPTASEVAHAKAVHEHPAAAKHVTHAR